MKKSIAVIITLLATGALIAADKPAYRLFFKGGTPARYADLVNRAANADVILFGELHGRHIVHWLQLELAKDIVKRKKSLVIGAEMFERDDQVIIDEYFKGWFSRSRFESEAKLWPNYKADYRPLLEFARKNGLTFLATNVPRRYASLVFRQGLGALSRVDGRGRLFLPSLPIAFDPSLPGYKKMAQRLKGHGHRSAHLAEAQALKDATMAEAILKHHEKGTPVLHINGTYHSDNFEGISWYLKRAKKDLIIVTVSTIAQNDLSAPLEENKMKADFLLVIPPGHSGR